MQGWEQLRENIIFLVDSSPAMREQAQGDLPSVWLFGYREQQDLNRITKFWTFAQEYEGKTWLQIALMTYESFLKSRIISNANDQLALVLYGTVKPHTSASLHAVQQRIIDASMKPSTGFVHYIQAWSAHAC